MHVSKNGNRLTRIVLSILALLFMTGTVWAQNIKVSGVVTDDKGEPIIGASVLVQGTKTGSAADLDGKFTLTIPGNAVLEITAIGYERQVIPLRNRTTLKVILREDAVLLEEAVVVGEFGVKRAARAVGGAVQSVRGAEIAESGRENFVVALQGRIAGLQVTNSGGTPGASSSVLIRGATSISGNNQPLFVIDGIPMNNKTFDPVTSMAVSTIEDRYLDFSNRGADLNPEDIESMTVLKGAAAAALYGSDASNGAIIITTKKGKQGKGTVSYSNYFRFDNAYRYPQLQDKYDNGVYGTTNYYNFARYGSPYPVGTTLYNNLENLFQTGITQRHNVSFDAGSDNLTFRASASTHKQTGIVPNTDLTRDNITIAGQGKITKWLSLEASMSYAATTNNKASKGAGGVLDRAMRWPLTDDMREYMDASGTMIRFPNKYQDKDVLNPYFDLYKNKNYDASQRVISNMSVNVTPFKDFFLKAQVGWDYAMNTYEVIRHPYWAASAAGVGTYDQARQTMSYPTLQFISSYKKDIGKFSATAQVGYHQLEQNSNTMAVHGEKFLVPDFQSINNCTAGTITSKTNRNNRRLQAFSGSLEFSYNNIAFVTVRGRNDWSSTLPVNNNQYFYPAIDGSFILSDLPFIKAYNETFSYLKLRASWAKVGKDAPPLSIYPALFTSALTGGGYRYDFTGPNPNLRPEMNTSWEVGLEGRLFRNRMDIDFAYFNTLSADQIITGFRLSYGTGFVLNNMNVGTFRTDGFELRIAGDIIKNRTWLLNMGVNISKGWSEVTDLPANVTEYYNAYTWVSGNLRNGIKVGYPITTITGNDFQTNTNGDILIDPSSGLPLTRGDWTVVGDREPFLKYGFTGQLKYKSLSLSAVLDGRIGATVVNGTKRYMMQQGYSWESVALRERGPVVFKGVLKDGNEETSPTVNTISVKYEDISTGYSGADANWVEKDINYLKLAEMRLSYSFDRKKLEKATKGLLSAASVFVSGTDLFIITNYSGIDVVGNSNSAALGGTGGVGFDSFAIAAPRGLSFGLNVTF